MLKEVGRRLKDEEAAAKLPATTLLQLGMKYLNYLDLKTRLLEEQKNAERDLPIIQIIEAQDMDPSRKIELLDEYIATLTSDLAAAKKARKEIK